LNLPDLVTPHETVGVLPSVASFNVGNYRIEVFSSVNQLTQEWEQFARQYNASYCIAKIGIPEKSVLTDFAYFYVAAKRNNEVVALFYFQTLLIRKDYYPDFSKLSFTAKNLYCLIAAHNYQLLINGHIFIADFPGAVFSDKSNQDAELASMFDKVATKLKRICDSSIFIIKDAHPLISKAIKGINKYRQMPDDVLMEMQIPSTWKNTTDYIAMLSKKYAARAGKLEQSIKQFELEELDERQIRQQSPVLEKLYMNVMSKSSFKPGVLNMSFFALMKAAYKNKFRLYIWRLHGEVAGFTSYIIHNNSIELYYIGMDYKINRSHHLYQCMLQQGIADAILMQKQILKLGRTAYEAKAIAGAKPMVKNNFYHISNPVLRIGFKYVSDYFIAENNNNWQIRNPFR
jgi:hypothetical protein